MFLSAYVEYGILEFGRCTLGEEPLDLNTGHLVQLDVDEVLDLHGDSVGRPGSLHSRLRDPVVTHFRCYLVDLVVETSRVHSRIVGAENVGVLEGSVPEDICEGGQHTIYVTV